jgi:DNA-3-methyladenine glycosylase II
MRTHEIPVATPYRLDLTVRVLRRLSTNVVDVLTPDGEYVRALPGAHGPVIVRATQPRNAGALSVAIDGDASDDAAVLDVVRRILAADRDLTEFERAAAGMPWLAPLVTRMRGVKPPRYPTLWEACANAIIFQQVSIWAASAIMGRVIVALGQPLTVDGVATPMYAFPPAESVEHAPDARLRAAGLSASKIATLRRVGEGIASGELDAAALETSASADVAAVLRRIKGIGPWTAALILLRGLGRLDVFPANDSSVANNFALVSGSAPIDPRAVLEALGTQRGMLYFHLLLARLESRGEGSRGQSR